MCGSPSEARWVVVRGWEIVLGEGGEDFLRARFGLLTGQLLGISPSTATTPDSSAQRVTPQTTFSALRD